ncbi:hypothetical protein SAMN04487881_0126 [Marinobacter sp. es.048]|uniref:hypothetical protein n=1 Tax=Marinobacter sp. es.048 TaxID=1761795 RepID=UPI000B593723|nr:hypothetical protein [Marinobacter sp. es.048]SNC59784.1 hypothetical protein SAMN04487881_0126 [Marinobacter sp. es.048]
MKTQPLVLLSATVVLAIGLVIGTGESQSASKETTQLVPLAYAENWGAARLDDGLREQFLNDPNNMVRLPREDIRKRNNRELGEWLPASGQCDYLGKLMSVMEHYELHHKHEQWQGLLVKRQRCYTRFQ